MSPALIALLFSLVEEAIKIQPALAAEITALFAKGAPTPDDWIALRAKVLGESFADLAPDAAANLKPPTDVVPTVETPAPTPETEIAAAPASHTRADGTTVIIPA